MIPIFIGFDPRETVAYHVLCQSIIERTTQPVSITPLHTPMLGGEWQQDGTNAFTYSRFLVPELMDYQGWAFYLDSDMLVRGDLSELWEWQKDGIRDDSKAVMVCQHDYKTRHPRKLIGTPMEAKNEDYPRKNWSSMILWNCAHPQNKILTTQFVAEAGGRRLHRFEWLSDDLVGSIPLEWNHLVGEYAPNPEAKIAHFTLGMPGFEFYRHCEFSSEWRQEAIAIDRKDEEWWTVRTA